MTERNSEIDKHGNPTPALGAMLGLDREWYNWKGNRIYISKTHIVTREEWESNGVKQYDEPTLHRDSED